jgi:hypothetical protein
MLKLNLGCADKPRMKSRKKLRTISPFPALASLAFLATILLSCASSAQSTFVPVAPEKLLTGSAGSFPIYDIALSKQGHENAPQEKIQSTSQLTCVEKQLSELKRAAEMVGGEESFVQALKKKDFKFRLKIADATESRSSSLAKKRAKMSYESFPGSTKLLTINGNLFVDQKTHLVVCDTPKAEEILIRIEGIIPMPAKDLVGQAKSVTP